MSAIKISEIEINFEIQPSIAKEVGRNVAAIIKSIETLNDNEKKDE